MKSSILGRCIFAAIGVLLAAGGIYWLVVQSRPSTPSDKTRAQPIPLASTKKDKNAPKPHEKTPQDAAPKDGNSFLEAFGGSDGAAESSEAVLSNQALEERFASLLKERESYQEFVARVSASPENIGEKELRDAIGERDRRLESLNKTLAVLDRDIALARKARPKDAVPQWLTAELLIDIGSEPEMIAPYLERALQGGLDRPRLFASLARVEIESNLFDKAYESATKALERDPHDRYVWKAYALAAFNLQRFAEVAERLHTTFGDQRPVWTKEFGQEAGDGETRWQVEQKLRAAEKTADNLPRVKIVVEHRRFARRPDGSATTKIESTGREEFILELLEDQAPITVANFINLVEQKAYDGTRFHLAESAAVVVGGDVKSKTGDPADDGAGGPGYVIPDENKLPLARNHFRGSLSMVNTGPKTAGSQFFITLVPKHEMDGHFTVFGRVIEGMEAVDRISRGRTNLEIGRYGLIIPGDLLVRAEVLRKRPHEYKVLKEMVK